MTIVALNTVKRIAERKLHAIYQEHGWPVDIMPRISPGLVRIILETADEVRAQEEREG